MNLSSNNTILAASSDLHTNAFFRKQKLIMGVMLLGFILITLGASALTEFNLLKAFQSFPKAMGWVVENFVPDAKAIERLPKILEKLVETVFISIMSSVSATALAFFTALLAARTTTPHPVVSYIIKAIASVARNIPVVAWALIFLLSFGQSSFTGFLALFFTSFGFLTRAISDTIDESARRPVEALKASGASYFQIIFQAVIPMILTQIVSWVLFMIEVNIRSATLVGLLTGSGIGFLFDLYRKQSGLYKSAALIVICIMLVVLIIEGISNYIRRKIL